MGRKGKISVENGGGSRVGRRGKVSVEKGVVKGETGEEDQG